MKNGFVSVLVILLFASTAFAAEFSPTLLKLSAPEIVQYDFDGSEIKIPITVSGKPAGLIFCVYTKDISDQISNIQNGYLGWHYVNKVDTSLYISSITSFDIGKNNVVWNGKDDDGNVIPAGEYTYYMWAYDNISTSIKVANIESNMWPDRHSYIEEYGENGAPLANPLYIDANEAQATQDQNRVFKWTIGSDPDDPGMAEYTNIPFSSDDWRTDDTIALQPDDHSNFFTHVVDKDTGFMGIWKMQWVPNGDAVRDETWGTDGAYTIPYVVSGARVWDIGVVSDGNYLYTSIAIRGETITNFYTVDFDGNLVKELDIGDWWVSLEDQEAGAQVVGGPNSAWERNGKIVLNAHTSCLKSMVDPIAGLDDEDNFWLWHNGNGDYVNDHNFEEDSGRPWVCFDYNVGPYTYSISADDNLFSCCSARDMGAVSFGLMAPDGTGIAYFAFAGETAGPKRGKFFCDSGSAFDGIYTCNKANEDETIQNGVWYIAHDSINGVITSKVAVDEAAPAAFAVAQNSPNPFNPSTTISFSITDAGNVAIDVFNVTGQKVDTIASEFMSAGSHSVSWDASGFSAGVYFYTVKSGDFSKTMKMTLLK